MNATNSIERIYQPTILQKILIVVICGFVYFSYAMSNIAALFSFIAVSIYFASFFGKSNNTSFASDKFWCIFVSWIFITTSYSPLEAAFRGALLILFATFVKYGCLKFNILWVSTLLKIIFVFSAVHVFFTILQLFLPSLISQLTSIVLSGDNLLLNRALSAKGTFPGITNQTGTNAYFIATFIGVVIANYHTFQKKNITYVFYSLLLIAFFAMILTVKRSPIIAALFSSFVVYFMYSRFIIEKKSDIIVFILLIFSLFYFLISFIPETDELIKKFSFDENSDFTSGRLERNEEMLKIFEMSPWIGNGYGAVKDALEATSHNVYIQLLAETGVIGFGLFITTVILSLVNTIYCIIKYGKNIYCIMPFAIQPILFSLYFQLYFILWAFTGPVLSYPFVFVMYCLSISISQRILIAMK